MHPTRLERANWRLSLDCGVRVAIGVAPIAVVACLTSMPLIAPPLGATVYLCATIPLSPTVRTRNIVFGHAIAILCGYLALSTAGLCDAPSAALEGYSSCHATAAVVALVLTVIALVALGMPHPPCGATTLIVALGVLRGWPALIALECGAILTALWFHPATPWGRWLRP